MISESAKIDNDKFYIIIVRTGWSPVSVLCSYLVPKYI